MKLKTHPLVLLIPVGLFLLSNNFHWKIAGPFMGMVIGVGFASYLMLANKRYDLILPILGGLLDLLAITVNGGVMPVLNPLAGSLDASHTAYTSATHLGLLCDIIPIGHIMIISIGDVFIFFLWPMYLILPKPPPVEISVEGVETNEYVQ